MKNKIESFEESLVESYARFLLELDVYEKDPYRNKNNFWIRDESFEAYLHFIRHKYFK
jgi:hypothetical protein